MFLFILLSKLSTFFSLLKWYLRFLHTSIYILYHDDQMHIFSLEIGSRLQRCIPRGRQFCIFVYVPISCFLVTLCRYWGCPVSRACCTIAQRRRRARPRARLRPDRLAFAPSDLVCIDIFCMMYLIYGEPSERVFSWFLFIIK